MRKTSLVGIYAISFVAVLMSPILHAEELTTPAATAKNDSAPIPDDLDKRGKLLRAAIGRKYDELAALNRLTRNGSYPPTSIPDQGITDVVLEYIPLGTSFDDAEHILRSALGGHPKAAVGGHLKTGQ